METQFFDVFVTEGENPTFAYRTGLTTYTEGLRDGIFTALGWNGAGYMALAQDGYDPTILNPADYIAPQAFELELDGQSLMSHWAYEGLERLEGKDNLTVKITLRHTVRPVTVRVCTLLDGSCVSVSYTHLDVYKRQGYWNWRINGCVLKTSTPSAKSLRRRTCRAIRTSTV